MEPDLTKIEMKHKWHERRGFKTLTVGLVVPGFWSVYNDLPWSNTVGHLQVTDVNMGQPEGYLNVLNVKVESNWRRMGLGKMMYREANRLAKEAGFLGVASDVKNRSNDAERVWGKLGARNRDGYDVLESLIESLLNP